MYQAEFFLNFQRISARKYIYFPKISKIVRYGRQTMNLKIKFRDWQQCWRHVYLPTYKRDLINIYYEHVEKTGYIFRSGFVMVKCLCLIPS